MEHRACIVCGIVKPDREFYRRADGGVRNQCKACMIADAAIRSGYHRLSPAQKRERRRTIMAERDAELRAWVASIHGEEYANLPAHDHAEGPCLRCEWLERTK